MDERRPPGARAVPPPARPRRRTTAPSCSRRTCSGRRSPAARSPRTHDAACRASTTSREAALDMFRPAVLRRPRRVVPLRARARPRPRACSRCRRATAWSASGVHVPERYDPDGFRARHGVDATVRAVRRPARRRQRVGSGCSTRSPVPSRAYDLPFALVTIGTGEVHPPAAIADRVIDLGFCRTADRDDAFAAADAYVQPSALESFSRTIMEAWLAGTLVIANARERRRRLALRAVRRRARSSRTPRSSRNASASSPTSPRPPRARAARAARTCSTTTLGRRPRPRRRDARRLVPGA